MSEVAVHHNPNDRLEYGKYLFGRSYVNFEESIRSKHTLKQYKHGLFKFCKAINMTTEDLATRYSESSKTKKKLSALELQNTIQDYVIVLKQRLNSGQIRPASVIAAVPPIRHFCEMNDILINFRKIGKLLPQNEDNAKDQAYTRDQIKKMLQYTDIRSKIIILFLASSGMRIGGFADRYERSFLKDGDISPLCDPEGKLIAAHVMVYRGTKDEYDAFITPEAYNAYVEYRNLRIKFGEKITPDSPVLIRRFEITPGKEPKIDVAPISDRALDGLLSRLMFKAGIRVPSKHYNGRRYETKISHGFRKFFKSTIADIRTKDGRSAVEPLTQEWLYGHALGGLMRTAENYDRRSRKQMLLDSYLLAVRALTISDEERLLVQVKKLEVDISNMKSVQSELSDKDTQMKAMEERHRKEIQQLRRDMKREVAHILRKIKPEIVMDGLS